jgi:hypothetical protein
MGKITKRAYYRETLNGGFIATKLNTMLGWGRKYSLF